jgi:hypothetical protein
MSSTLLNGQVPRMKPNYRVQKSISCDLKNDRCMFPIYKQMRPSFQIVQSSRRTAAVSSRAATSCNRTTTIVYILSWPTWSSALKQTNYQFKLIAIFQALDLRWQRYAVPPEAASKYLQPFKAIPPSLLHCQPLDLTARFALNPSHST